MAKRLDTLDGKTIGELWNLDFHGDELFRTLETELTRLYPGIKFVSYEVFGSTHGAKEAAVLAALPDKLCENGCEAVISGVGC
ncbi:MAG: hypothetical protein HYY45_09710 [Deltaproteobacteria bacterium]|nr:hypothetical protein [Deltaproteobacteria bacterium]